jgi:hypothetical protein
VEEFFRVISLKSVIRYEYYYKNRRISMKYIGIKHLFNYFKFLKNLDKCDRTVKLWRILDRYVGTLSNFQTEKFFRVISLKSVIRYEYYCINRCISSNYIGIKHLFNYFKFLKNLDKCDRTVKLWRILERYVGTLKNFKVEKFFRVISLKSVIRYEYYCINRCISTKYTRIKHLFRPRNV